MPLLTNTRVYILAIVCAILMCSAVVFAQVAEIDANNTTNDTSQTIPEASNVNINDPLVVELNKIQSSANYMPLDQAQKIAEYTIKNKKDPQLQEIIWLLRSINEKINKK